jgi:hypothetical protein
VVTAPSALELRLARVLRLGAILGVVLTCASVLALAALDEPLRPWPLSLRACAEGSDPWLRVLAALGLWTLAATPSVMLLACLIDAARARRWRALGTALAILALGVLGLGLAWVGV